MNVFYLANIYYALFPHSFLGITDMDNTKVKAEHILKFKYFIKLISCKWTVKNSVSIIPFFTGTFIFGKESW